MALLHSATYKGIPLTDTYLKITAYRVRDEIIDGVKTYIVMYTTTRYKDSTKVYELESWDKDIYTTSAGELTLSDFYTDLKTEFPTATDI